MARSGPPRKAGHRQIEAAPEEMHGTDLAQKSGTISFEDAIDGHQRAEVTRNGLSIVGAHFLIRGERNGMRQFARLAEVFRCRAEVAEQLNEPRVKVGHRHALETELCAAPVRGDADLDPNRPVRYE